MLGATWKPTWASSSQPVYLPKGPSTVLSTTFFPSS